MRRRLLRRTIWDADAISPDEWKFRNLMRIALPVYDAIVVGAGVWAMLWGSPILHRLFPEHVIVLLGALLSAAGISCAVGVIFPALWRLELMSKVALVALLGTYAVVVLLFRSSPDPSSAFVVFILLLALPLPLFRLSLLGEDIKERREEEA